MVDSFEGKQVSIYVDLDNTDLAVTDGEISQTDIDSYTTSAKELIGVVMSHDESGGEESLNSEPMLGGANVSYKDSMTKIGVDWSVAILQEDSTFFDSLKFGDGLNSAGSSKIFSVLFLAEDEESGKVHGRYYRNCRTASWNPTFEAGEFAQGDFTYETAPTDSNAESNLRIIKTITTV